MWLIFGPLSLFAVVFLSWLLAKTIEFRGRWFGAVILGWFLIVPCYSWIASLADKVYADDLLRLSLLQAIVVALTVIARQLRFTTFSSRFRHDKVLSLLFIVQCIPFLWFIIHSNGIIVSDRTDTDLRGQMPELLCAHIAFMILILLPRAAKWESEPAASTCSTPNQL